jgi:hypothetical protein
VHCQRLFFTGALSRYIEVPALSGETGYRAGDAETGPPAALDELRALRELRKQQGEIVTGAGSAKEVSPWLLLTRWPDYLQGQKLSEVAALTALPRPDEEPMLATLCQSIDRLVAGGYRSVVSDRINSSDQMRINSFV